MTSEQRLSNALRTLDDYEPSQDLWNRVLYSIEEDKAHRRRLRRTGSIIVLVVAACAAVAWLATSPLESNGRNAIDWRVLEALETGVLVSLILTLGPAIRRFGRNYVGELFTTSPSTGSHLLRLLDIAYYLVFAGYVMQSAEFEAPSSFLRGRVGEQLNDALARIAELLVGMGLLHAATFMALPLVALVFNSTHTCAKLPRWVVLAVGAAVVPALLVLLLVVGAGAS